MEMFGSFRVVLMAILIASPLLHAAEPVYVFFKFCACEALNSRAGNFACSQYPRKI